MIAYDIDGRDSEEECAGCGYKWKHHSQVRDYCPDGSLRQFRPLFQPMIFSNTTEPIKGSE